MKKLTKVICWIFAGAAIASGAIGLCLIWSVAATIRSLFLVLAIIMNVIAFFLNPFLGLGGARLEYISLDATFRGFGESMKLIADKVLVPEDL